MSTEHKAFWKRVVESQLLTLDECRVLAREFAQTEQGKSATSTESLARWLVEQGVLTRGQAKRMLNSTPLLATAVPAVNFNIVSESAVSVAGRTRQMRRRSRQRLYVVAAVAGAPVLTIIAVIIFALGQGDHPGTALNNRPQASAAPSHDGSKVSPLANTDADEAPTGDPVEAAATSMMWQSPTSGEPLDLRLLPAASTIVAWRPAEFLTHPEGEKLLDVLGELGRMARDEIAAIVGTPLANVEEVLMAVVQGGDERPQACFVLRMCDEIDADALRGAWGNLNEERVGNETVLWSDDRAYFLADAAPHRRIVAGPLGVVREIAADSEQQPLVRREIEALLRLSDADRHFTLICVPSGLFSSHIKSLKLAEAEALGEPLEQWLDGAAAALVSVHLSADDFFVESRVVPQPDESAARLAPRLRGRLRDACRQVDESLRAVTRTSYNEQILARYPRMVELFEQFTRIAPADRTVLLRTYLPGIAGHNLVLGAILAHAAPASVLAESPVVAEQAPLALSERLRQPLSFRMPRNTLEAALGRFGEAIDAKVEILGADLQVEGITKNQSLALDVAEAPAAEVLTSILRLANPDGKLVATIKKQGEPPREIICITTRAAAQTRGDEIAAEPQPSGGK